MQLSAKEQLLEARALGHEPSIMRRDPPPEFDVPPKFWLSCTCGYESTRRRTQKAALGALVWHLGKVLGEAEFDTQERQREMRRNGLLA